MSQIRPPADPDAFFDSGAYGGTRYGTDFVDWYNGSLVAHGRRMLTTVIDALGHHFRRADVGYKVPGIHWQMGDGSPYPRATEVTTGLIQTSVDESAWRTGHGYARIVEARLEADPRATPGDALHRARDGRQQPG